MNTTSTCLNYQRLFIFVLFLMSNMDKAFYSAVWVRGGMNLRNSIIMRDVIYAE